MSAAENEKLMEQLFASVAAGDRKPFLDRIADGDHAVVESVGMMQTRAGVPYNNEYCLVYRLKDGKIVEIREYCDSALTEKVLGPFPAERQQA